MDYIGHWLARHRSGSKRHLVESEVTDRLVMRCGKEMKLILGDRGMHPFEDHPLCQTCRGDD
jgi:hypothetical protein